MKNLIIESLIKTKSTLKEDTNSIIKEIISMLPGITKDMNNSCDTLQEISYKLNKMHFEHLNN